MEVRLSKNTANLNQNGKNKSKNIKKDKNKTNDLKNTNQNDKTKSDTIASNKPIVKGKPWA